MHDQAVAAYAAPHVESTRVALGLREIRALRRRYWFVLFAGIPSFWVAFALVGLIGTPPQWIMYAVWLGVGIGWLSLTNKLERQVWAARCPRCGLQFHAPSWYGIELRGVFLRSCQHCGLRLRADRHPEPEQPG